MTGKLIQRLQDPSRSGVYRVSRADEVVDAVKGSGLSPVRVKFADKAQLLKTSARRLGFPDWFGDNWDALEDCLTDLSWREAPAHVLLIEEREAGRRPRRADRRAALERRILGGTRQAVLRGLRRSGARAAAAGAVPRADLKLPLSVLVVVHTAELEVLLLERAARPGFWQSVTGSLDRPDEPFEHAAARELREETGIEAARWPPAALERGLYLRDLRAVAAPLRARRDAQHRASFQPGARQAARR